MNKLNWEGNFKKHFHESWHRWLQQAIENEYMYNIYQTLKDSDTRVVPVKNDLFRSFKECSYDEIKAVIVLSDPYPWIKDNIVVADGIPMSCSHTQKCQPSLVKFYEAMQRELEEEIEYQPDLTYLLNQGVFMVNTSLTCKANIVGSHNGKDDKIGWLWEPFMEYLFKDVLDVKTGISYWLLGNEAKRVNPWLNPLGNHIYTLEHPAAASWKKTDWESKGMFKKINSVIKSNNRGEEIMWNYKEYISIQAPF